MGFYLLIGGDHEHMSSIPKSQRTKLLKAMTTIERGGDISGNINSTIMCNNGILFHILISTNLFYKSKIILISAITGCSNGDVKWEDDKTPYIFWSGAWFPICGHRFWDNQIGAQKFCNILGYQNGEQWGEETARSYEVDAFRVGKCEEADDWFQKCTGGCNDYKVGGRCSDDSHFNLISPENCGKEARVAIKITCFPPKMPFLKSSCVGKMYRLK